LRLYREQYAGFNARHFHQIARREHGVTLSYTYVKTALQKAGLLPKHRARGRHGAAASRGHAGASWSTSTAAAIAGSRWSPSSGRP
jgi:hypothetical protein